MLKRDDFRKNVKESLARRVAFICSNPECQKLTIGPDSKPTGSVSIGVAAHITAAAPGGKRYDPTLTTEERKGFDNGIWLCQNCAKLIDSDEAQYAIDVLSNWKIEAENRAKSNFEGLLGFSSPKIDRTLLAQANLLEQLGEMLSDDTDKTIETMRSTWREGHKEVARDQLKALKSDHGRWNILSNEVKAKILRFEAGLVLESENGLLAAKNLAGQAYDLDPSDENQSKIMALIARQEGSMSNAIGYLEKNKHVDSLNMLAALYLELGDNTNCRRVLDGIDLAAANAETYRLRALLHLFDKDIEQARVDINKAEQLSPKWYIVKLNRAMIDFFSGISNALLPNRPILWPEPITPDMVKQDRESVAYLQNATNLLEELSTYENPGVDDEIIRNWRWACKLVNSFRHDDISGLINSNLKLNPTDYYLIIWALELNYKFDFASSEKALLEILDSGKGTIFHVIALSGLLIKRAGLIDAENLLNNQHSLFIAQKAEPLWQFWMVQILGLQGRADEANKMIDQFGPDQNLKYAKGLVFSIQAQKTGSNTVIIDYLEQQYAETKDPQSLLQVCQIKFSEHDWKFVANRASSLVRSYQTADILRFAIVATFNSQDFELCLDLIEVNQYMFGEEVPGDIRRLKAICLREKGLLKAAIAEMEALPAHSTHSLFQMAHMYLQQGDLKKFSVIGRQLVEKPDLGSVEALQLAHYLRQEDPELAKTLFKKAESGKLPSTHLGNFLFTAFNLGLDNETKPIHELISQTNSEETGLKLLSFEDLKSLIAEEDLEAKRIQDLLMLGSIPVHLFSQRLHLHLTHLYHNLLDNNEKETNALLKTPIFVRHGGKPIANLRQNLNEINLYVDITSILLAEHLDLLDLVEKNFAVINIPNQLIVSLVEMRDQLLHHQPSQLNAADLLVRLVQQKRLKILESDSASPAAGEDKPEGLLANHARDHLGKVLVFNSTLQEIFANQGADSLFVSARGIFDTLLKQGKISSEKHSGFIDLLGTEGADNPYDSDLEIGVPLYCWQNSIDLFANIGALELVCNHFDVYIQSDYLSQQELVIQSYKQMEQTSKWLLGLIERLRRGIDSEKYRFMAIQRGDSDDEWKFDPFGNLKALFTFPKDEKGLIWSDDRHLNSFSNRDGIPIVGVNEILEALKSSGAIDQKLYFSVVNRMRVANLLFIPLNAEEIYHFLLQATRQDSLLQETPELTAMKLYAMRALELVNYLQKPDPNQPNPQGEIGFLLQYVHAPQDAIIQVWESSELSIRDKQLCSNWILDNLFVDYPALANILGIQQTKEHQEYLAALRLMGALVRGLALPGKDNENSQSKRAAYLEWVYERLVASDLNFNPSILKTLLDLLKQNILENIRESAGDIPPGVLDIVYQSYCSDLPEPIQKMLEEDDEFMMAIGVHFLVTVGNYQFEADYFWNLMGEVAKSGEVKVIPKNRDYQISIAVDSKASESGLLSVFDPKADQTLPIRIPEYEILSPDKDTVISFLRKNRGLFDCSDQELTEVIDNVLSTSSLRTRVERFLKFQEMNLGNHYSNLLQNLRQRHNFTIIELLPPKTVDIARFYRINLNIQKPFSLIWKDSATTLLNSHGIVEMLSRLWSVPVPLPEIVYARFDKLDSDRQKKHIKDLIKNSRSPIAMMHLTKLLLRLGEKSPLYRRFGLQKLKYMLTDEYEKDVKTLISVLQWVVGNLRVAESDSATIKLLTIWSHSHQLYSILTAAGAPVDWIQSFFAQNMVLPRSLFEDKRELLHDISFPHNITSQAIILSAIAYCTTGENLVLNDEFRLDVANIAFLHVNEQLLPHPYLMDDITTLTDHLESIWSGDRGEKLSDILSAEISEILSSSSLNNLLEGVLNNLESRKQELSAWVDLFATTRGICIPETKKDKLIASLAQTDFSQLFEKDVTVGKVAVHLTSIVAYTTASEQLSSHLSLQLELIAKKLNQLYPAKAVNRLDEETQKRLSDTTGILLEAALNISKLQHDPEERAIAFIALCKEMAKHWDYFAVRSRAIVQALSERLPIEQSKHIWRLLIFLRTIG